jgi:hypothetical protein
MLLGSASGPRPGLRGQLGPILAVKPARVGFRPDQFGTEGIPTARPEALINSLE